jgi:hypothetical protein
MKRICALVAALALCIGGVTASARSSYYLDAYSAWLIAGSNGKIDIAVDVQATDDMDEVGAKRIQLMESSDGGATWDTVRIYVQSLYPNMYTTNNYYYLKIPVSYAGTVGYQYRAYVTVYASDSTGSDSRIYKTSVVTAKQ